MIPDWDDAYANGKYFAGTDDCVARWARAAPAYRQELLTTGRFHGGISYGPRNREKFDLCMPVAAIPKGLAVFVHGGYWRSFAKDEWTHLARGANDRGLAMAIIGYDLCPDVRIGQISRQVEAGISAAATIASPARSALPVIPRAVIWSPG